jgi:succinate dehydrogenase subunit C
MNQATTPFHPKWYRERTSTYWWMSSWPYFTFIVRELSSVFVAWTIVFLLKLVNAVAHGPGWYDAFLRWAEQPWVVTLNLAALFLVVFHAVTWFNLAPAAMVVHMGGRRVPGSLIVAGNYAAWLAASAVIAWGLFGK